MDILARYAGATRNSNDALIIMFVTDADESALQELSNKRLRLSIDEAKNTRSLNANAYFWQLCDKIAKALHSTKDLIYIWLLQTYGVFDMYEIAAAAVNQLKPFYKIIHTKELYTATNEDGKTVNMALVFAYKGSHEYNTKEMADLIDGAVSEANELGIETLTEEELNRLKGGWTK